MGVCRLLIHRIFLAALLLTTTASAAITELTPTAPTSATPVSLTITSEPSSPCPPTVGSLTRSGNTVRLALVPFTGACIAIIAPWKATFDLGTFAPGEYTVDVTLGGQPYVATKFVVRNAAPAFTLQPFAHVARPAGAQTDGGVEAVIDGVDPAQLCTFELCPNVKVLFGDVVAQPRMAAGKLTVRVPPHAPGVVDMKIVAEDRGVTLTSAGAAYFYDRSAAPDLSVWSRVLFPVLQSSAGAFGAQWITDAVVRNGNSYIVENFNRVDPFQCFDVGCERMSAGEYRKFEGRDHPRGAVLLVPRESVDAFSFGSRVRDRAREGEDFGTELPVLRESAMRRARFRLLDIPVTSAYRSKLRVYVYTPDDGLEATIVGSFPDREGGFLRRLPLERVDRTFAYAEIELQTIPDLKSDRLILEVLSPSELPAWAFVTVTNNASQRVTLVTPN